MKKILFIVFSIAIMSCMLAGCEEKESNTYKDESNTQQSAALININNILSYDNSTRIVYWYFKDGAGRTSTGFMSHTLAKTVDIADMKKERSCRLKGENNAGSKMQIL